MIEFQSIVDTLRKTLTTEQQEILSLNSIQNFIWSFDKLKNYKLEVQKLLNEYFEEIGNKNYLVDKNTSTRLSFDYIMKIDSYYSADLGFKIKMKLRFALMWGIHLDLFLLIIGILKKVYYMPIVTLLMLSTFLYLKEVYERKNMVYNMRY